MEESLGYDSHPIEEFNEYCMDARPFVERYYTQKDLLDPTGGGEDICILIHSNKLVLLTLPASHPIRKENLNVLNIDFQVSASLNRAQNIVSGKGKKGAQFLSPKSHVCTINCDSGQTFVVKAGMSGRLLEVNDLLISNPNLIKESGSGYIAILCPKNVDSEKHNPLVRTCKKYKSRELLKD